MALSTGTVAEWAYGRISEDRILGWCAIYWDGQGSATTGPDYYTSVQVPWGWATFEPNPENLPTTGLQFYLLFYRRHAHMYTDWYDGYDEYWMWGKTDMVTGLLLPDNKWRQLHDRVWAEVWGHRGQFKGAETFWLNEVPD